MTLKCNPPVLHFHLRPQMQNTPCQVASYFQSDICKGVATTCCNSFASLSLLDYTRESNREIERISLYRKLSRYLRKFLRVNSQEWNYSFERKNYWKDESHEETGETGNRGISPESWAVTRSFPTPRGVTGTSVNQVERRFKRTTQRTCVPSTHRKPKGERLAAVPFGRQNQKAGSYWQ